MFAPKNNDFVYIADNAYSFVISQLEYDIAHAARWATLHRPHEFCELKLV